MTRRRRHRPRVYVHCGCCGLSIPLFLLAVAGVVLAVVL